MFFQASAPPPPAPSVAAAAPAATSPPQAMRMMTIAQKIRPLSVSKGGRTETLAVRYQIFIRTNVRPGAAASIEGQPIVARPCFWTIETFLQRELCFHSMTGQTSCTDPVSMPVQAAESGQGDLPVEQACDVLAKPVELSEDRVIKSIDAISATVFDDDYGLKVRPLLAASGVTIAEQPLKPAPSRASGS